MGGVRRLSWLVNKKIGGRKSPAPSGLKRAVNRLVKSDGLFEELLKLCPGVAEILLVLGAQLAHIFFEDRVAVCHELEQALCGGH